MIELHLLRHAHAGDPEAWTGPDAARPLSDKGEGQAERLGRFLAASGFEPDAVISSPKVRALRTAEIVAGHLHLDVRVDERLAGGLGLADLDALLRDAGRPGQPVIVGHDPDFSELLAMLSGAAELPMRKGAIARIDVAGRLEPGGGVLRWLVPPELLKT
ncbi:MAG: histidine phosphatase family protein [Chloroflexi bacterium]|nr:histidine phosphatase family protein [Chloroflexota bacterium]